MKSTQFFVAACALFVSTTAFAQTTPTGTMQTGTGTTQGGTMQSGTMQNGTTTMPNQSGTNTGRMQNGTGTMRTGTGTMQNGTMDSKTKMNGRKGTGKSKTSTTPSTTGTM